MAEEITSEGKRLVDAWLGAQQRLGQAQGEVNRASCDVSNSATALGKWLLPKDAKPGEKYCVWYIDSLIAAELNEHGTPVVTLRTRGRYLDR